MANKKITITYTFVNPNTPKQFEQALAKILIEKLMSNNTRS